MKGSNRTRLHQFVQVLIALMCFSFMLNSLLFSALTSDLETKCREIRLDLIGDQLDPQC